MLQSLLRALLTVMSPGASLLIPDGGSKNEVRSASVICCVFRPCVMRCVISLELVNALQAAFRYQPSCVLCLFLLTQMPPELTTVVNSLQAAVAAAYVLSTPDLPPAVYMEEVRAKT